MNWKMFMCGPVCLLISEFDLGRKANESRITWLIEKFNKLNRIYRETYCDGGYYALLEMNGRFYQAERECKTGNFNLPSSPTMASWSISSGGQKKKKRHWETAIME